jgi:hypothetical protein
MPDPQPQNFQNHSRFPTAFVVAFVFLLLAFLLIAGGLVLSGWGLPAILTGAGGLLLGLGAMHAHYIARMNALCLQDRIIRLEMEVRLARVLPTDLEERSRALSIKQRVALRFASDAELPELVRKVLDERLEDGKTIKRMVKNWQADHQRV